MKPIQIYGTLYKAENSRYGANELVEYFKLTSTGSGRALHRWWPFTTTLVVLEFCSRSFSSFSVSGNHVVGSRGDCVTSSFWYLFPVLVAILSRLPNGSKMCSPPTERQAKSEVENIFLFVLFYLLAKSYLSASLSGIRSRNRRWFWWFVGWTSREWWAEAEEYNV